MSLDQKPARKLRSCEQEVHDEEGGTTSAGANSAWIRRHLADSIYLWACGEKADDEDEDPTVSERLVGWLILFMQGFAYTTLIFLARASSTTDASSSGDGSGESGYLLPSVTGAMYLLVASTTHDLRAGYSLLVCGSRPGHRAFGIGLLIVYGIMITAAMTVLVSTSEDSAAVVLNAVTVLFIADLDEKTLRFLSTVPQKWRLFWAIESIGISLALALVSIAHLGASSSLLEDSTYILSTKCPLFWFWAVSPAAITWCSFRLSAALHVLCETSQAGKAGEAGANTEQSASSFVLPRVFVVLRAAIVGIRARLRAEPCLFVFLFAWLVQGVCSWVYLGRTLGLPIVFTFNRDTSASDECSVDTTKNVFTLVFTSAVLAAGLAMKAVRVVLSGNKPVAATHEHKQIVRSEGDGPRERWEGCAYSRVPSLLVGWGIGYWVTSLLVFFGCSWRSGDCGCNNAPVIVTLMGYIIIPCFLVAGSLMVAEPNVLGTRFALFVKPAVDILRNRGSVVYWTLATVLRDVVILWTVLCRILHLSLQY